MYSKRPKPYDARLAAPKRLAANVRSMFARNTTSARQTQTLINDMASANVRHLPAPPADADDSNCARRLRKKMMRSSLWPKEYLARVRVLHRVTGEETWDDIAMLLPHEVIEMVFKFGKRDVLLDRSQMDPESVEVLNEHGPDFFGVGLHCDGVPHSWDREDSCEVVTMSFPGLGGAWRHLRIPLCALPHSSFSENTWDDLMISISWSLRHAHGGYHPADNHERGPLDAKRARLAGQMLRIRSALCEVRGDWKMLAETFHLPRWNEKGGICWSCECTLAEVVGFSFMRIYFALCLLAAQPVREHAQPMRLSTHMTIMGETLIATCCVFASCLGSCSVSRTPRWQTLVRKRRTSAGS